MKIAYISHHKRPCYEYNFFSKLGCDKIKFIDTNFDSYPQEHAKNIEYCKVRYKENKIANKLLHSSAAIVYYQGYEKYLDDVDLIIVLEVFSTLSRQFIEYAKKTGKKSISFVYELIPNHPIYRLPMGRSNKNYCIKNVDCMITVSDMAKKHLVHLGADQSKIITIYPGIDQSVFKPNREIKRKPERWIFVGKLEEHKGIDLVLNAYRRLLGENDELELWVIGDGSYKDQIVNMSKIHNNLKYLGRIDNYKLPQYLNQCGIYILPCRDTYKFGQKIGSEQFGFSLVEAMACGLAVVSTECGAIPEVITANNLVCPQSDLECLTQTLRSLKVPSISTIGQKNTLITQERYDINKQAKKFTEQMKKLLESNL